MFLKHKTLPNVYSNLSSLRIFFKLLLMVAPTVPPAETQTPVRLRNVFVAAVVRCFLRDPRNSNNLGNSINVIATCLSFG